jgi:hypothetical protein
MVDGRESALQQFTDRSTEVPIPTLLLPPAFLRDDNSSDAPRGLVDCLYPAIPGVVVVVRPKFCYETKRRRLTGTTVRDITACG